MSDKADRLGWVTACALLTAAVVVAYPLIGWLAWRRAGTDGLVAAAVAAGVCWLGATAALMIAAALKGPNAALNSMLLGMLCRMGLPLLAGAVLSSQGGQLAAGGVFGLIVVFYLLTLVVETLLSLRLLKSNQV